MHYDAERLLVDGYSVIHAWPALRALLERSLERARDRLTAELTRLQDAAGVLVTVVFDSRSGRRATRGEATAGVEVVFTRKGMTADTFIERVVARSATPERLLVATNDGAEAFMARSLGAQVITSEQLREWAAEEQESLRETVARLRRGRAKNFVGTVVDTRRAFR